MKLINVLLCITALLSARYISAQGEPPWRRPLKICSGSDGRNFGNIRTFQDSAGVPCILKLPSGVLISAFQWFRQPVGSGTWDRVAVKFSSDNGSSWTTPQPIAVAGLPQNFQRPFDPALAISDDGRIRIYFSSGLNMMLDTSINTYSAVSDDGINYVMDGGFRFSLPDKPVIDPAVIKFRGLWHLVNPVTAGTGAYHNISGDGLNFTRVQDIVSDASHSWIGNYMIKDTSELRFYGSGASVWFSSSPNGGQWSPFTATNVQGGDPAAIRLSDTNYLMIYTGSPYPNSINDQVEEDVNFELFQNYPNPFNPSTVIRYAISSSAGRSNGKAELRIFDVAGKVMRVFVNDVKVYGIYEVNVDAREFASGTYFYSLFLEGKHLATKRMVVLK
jgi:hypothetical protein